MTAFDSNGRRLPTHAGRARSDADPCHPRRARGRRPQTSSPAPTFEVFGDFDVLTKAGSPAVRKKHGAIAAVGSTSISKKNGGEDARPERIWDKAASRGHRREVRRKGGRYRGGKEDPASQAPPLLYDLTTLQGAKPTPRFGFPAKMHPPDRPGALRKAQGAHLSANRFALPARGSPGHRQRCHGGFCRSFPGRARPQSPRPGLGAPQQAHFQQCQGERSLCHRPHGHRPQEPLGN